MIYVKMPSGIELRGRIFRQKWHRFLCVERFGWRVDKSKVFIKLLPF